MVVGNRFGSQNKCRRLSIEDAISSDKLVGISRASEGKGEKVSARAETRMQGQERKCDKYLKGEYKQEGV